MCNGQRSSVGAQGCNAPALHAGRRSVPGYIPTQERGNENRRKTGSNTWTDPKAGIEIVMEGTTSGSIVRWASSRPVQGWVGVLLVAVFWPLNWFLPGLRTHLLCFPLWLG